MGIGDLGIVVFLIYCKKYTLLYGFNAAKGSILFRHFEVKSLRVLNGSKAILTKGGFNRIIEKYFFM